MFMSNNSLKKLWKSYTDEWETFGMFNLDCNLVAHDVLNLFVTLAPVVQYTVISVLKTLKVCMFFNYVWSFSGRHALKV